jgi:hypothetical protein
VQIASRASRGHGRPAAMLHSVQPLSVAGNYPTKGQAMTIVLAFIAGLAVGAVGVVAIAAIALGEWRPFG